MMLFCLTKKWRVRFIYQIKISFWLTLTSTSTILLGNIQPLGLLIRSQASWSSSDALIQCQVSHQWKQHVADDGFFSLGSTWLHIWIWVQSAYLLTKKSPVSLTRKFQLPMVYVFIKCISKVRGLQRTKDCHILLDDHTPWIHFLSP